MSPFGVTTLSWGEGGGREKKGLQKIVIRSRVLCNSYLQGFLHRVQVLLASIVASIKTNPPSKILQYNHANTTYLQTALSHDTFFSSRIFKRKAVVYFSFISNPTRYPAPTTRPQYFCLLLHINER